MPWLIIVLAAIAAGVVWADRRVARQPVVQPADLCRANPPSQETLWQDAEREIIAYRMRSNPGPL